MESKNSSKDSLIFRAVIQGYLDTGSVKRAADLAGVSEVKARRILLTEGLWFSDNSIRVGHYFEQGLSSKEIADEILRRVTNELTVRGYSERRRER